MTDGVNFSDIRFDVQGVGGGDETHCQRKSSHESWTRRNTEVECAAYIG